MSLTRIHGYVHYMCDCCPDSLDTQTKDFDEAKVVARDAGYIARCYNNVWMNFCGIDCANAFAKSFMKSVSAPPIKKKPA